MKAFVIAVVLVVGGATLFAGDEPPKRIVLPPLVPESPEQLAPLATEPATPEKPPPIDRLKAAEEWRELLALGRRRGGDEGKAKVEAFRDHGAAPWVRELADAFLEEWGYTYDHPKLHNPRRVWVPELPELKGRRSSRHRRSVEGISEVSDDGKVLSVELVESSGDDEIDFQVEKWARDAWYRPAMKGTKWIAGRASWAVAIK